ncbi:MAG TPA: hypothetical protein GXZ36_06540 [Firmicutes bacterium]|nr:hypothetical protein [Bacillota bacterium]
MLIILEYLWVCNPQVILELVERNELSDRVFAAFFEKERNNKGIRDTYAYLVG